MFSFRVSSQSHPPIPWHDLHRVSLLVRLYVEMTRKRAGRNGRSAQRNGTIHRKTKPQPIGALVHFSYLLRRQVHGQCKAHLASRQSSRTSRRASMSTASSSFLAAARAATRTSTRTARAGRPRSPSRTKASAAWASSRKRSRRHSRWQGQGQEACTCCRAQIRPEPNLAADVCANPAPRMPNPFARPSYCLLLDSRQIAVKRKLSSTPANIPTYSMASIENSSLQLAPVSVRPLGPVASMQACMAGMPAALAQPLVATGPTQPTQQQQHALYHDGGRLRGR